MKLLLVCVNKTYESIGAYHAARYSWAIKPEKVNTCHNKGTSPA